MDRDRLNELVKKRDAVNAQIERVKGRRDAALQAREALEEKCRQKNVDPDKLDETIEGLKARYEQMLSQAEQDVNEAEENLAPYLEAIR